MNKRNNKFYLVGIKGTGMTSLACYLKDLGYFVIGSDTEEVFFTDEILKRKNIQILIFNKNNITTEYTYIISNAYDYKNEEVSTILLNDFTYYYYDKFIGSFINKDIIAISGTHGKTTTAYFLSQMLRSDGSYIIGDGSGYACEESKYLILEACEYKEHFLSYNPYIALITNIDFDHPDYFKDIESTIKSFQTFASQSKIVVINNDDENTRQIKHPNLVTFGFDENSDYIIKIEEKTKEGYKVKLYDTKGNKDCFFSLKYFGIHSIYNFIGSVVCALLVGGETTDNVSLPRRRMMEHRCNNIILIDDYAHHPKEITCLYSSIKEKYPEYIYKVIFQPHTYSRTLALLDEFITSLDLFDEVYIAKTFASSREKGKEELETKVKKAFNKYKSFDVSVINKINTMAKEVWIFLGAGVINKYIFDIINKNKV